MKKIYFINILLFVFFVGTKAQIADLEIESTVQKDSLYLKLVEITDDVFVFELVNITKDTLHLFDSYLFERDSRIIGTYKDGRDMQRSRYLRRYDKKTGQCKLSFLPLLPYLTLRESNRVIFGRNKVARSFQVKYHFSPIPPQGRIQITVCKDAVFQETFVEEINLKEYTVLHNRGIRFSEDLSPKCENILIEFAVYRHIYLLTSIDAYDRRDINNFNEQALSYRIVSIVVDL
jgi:hypothetical protein